MQSVARPPPRKSTSSIMCKFFKTKKTNAKKGLAVTHDMPMVQGGNVKMMRCVQNLRLSATSLLRTFLKCVVHNMQHMLHLNHQVVDAKMTAKMKKV